ncbi:uncharacterized protein ARMOST_04497 [Armillaria ostoyae]|uniref:Uncharacterized protein n=1 Tax=Armillaria ostoyae TaxID=47428 RepID=A0A284QXH9_ARMOS|nr:uncharacterized protein ARMOST_04497 [Armillaria ostoyae]
MRTRSYYSQRRRLPLELITIIAHMAVVGSIPTMEALSLTCKFLLGIMRPILWRQVIVQNVPHFLMNRELDGIIKFFSRNKHLRHYVKKLILYNTDDVELCAKVTQLLSHAYDFVLIGFDFSQPTPLILNSVRRAKSLHIERSHVENDEMVKILTSMHHLRHLCVDGGGDYIYGTTTALPALPESLKSPITALTIDSGYPYVRSPLLVTRFIESAPDCFTALTALHIHLSPYALGHLAGFFDKVGSQLISLGWSVPLLDSVPPPLPLDLSKLVRLQQPQVNIETTRAWGLSGGILIEASRLHPVRSYLDQDVDGRRKDTDPVIQWMRLRDPAIQ